MTGSHDPSDHSTRRKKKTQLWAARRRFPALCISFIYTVFWLDQWMPAFILIGQNGSVGSGYFVLNGHFRVPLCPLFQSESKCDTILMKMTLICMKMKLHAELIFIWNVSHLNAFWNRGTRELGNGVLKISLFLHQMLIKRPLIYTIGSVFLHCHLYCNCQTCTSTIRACHSKNEAGKNMINILCKNSQVTVSNPRLELYILVNSRLRLYLLKKILDKLSY